MKLIAQVVLPVPIMESITVILIVSPLIYMLFVSVKNEPVSVRMCLLYNSKYIMSIGFCGNF